ncbi:hypothetical protein [Streptomyces coelicoflavus]|uniref:hypothetical protein n=1 Tax=Streptomyces coelicoflavus TaxID=285562 RepID=UPI0036C3748E
MASMLALDLLAALRPLRRTVSASRVRWHSLKEDLSRPSYRVPEGTATTWPR